MPVPTLPFAALLLALLPALALASQPRVVDVSAGHAPVQVRGDQPARLDMACHPLDTDFDDTHAHGDRFCVLVLEQSGQVALLGQWIQSADAAIRMPDTAGPDAQPMWLVHAE